jgi:pilus assembly protein CpaF
MLQALNTGHDGSLSTVHANSPEDALSRIETLTLLAGVALPLPAVRAQITTAVDAVVQVSRGADGRRVVAAVAEVDRSRDEATRVRALLAESRGRLAAAEPPRRAARRAGIDLVEAWDRCRP